MSQRAAQNRSDHHTREQIDNHRQIQLTAAGVKISYGGHPNPIRALCGKIAFQQIRRHRQIVFAVGSHPIFAADLGTKSRFAHPPGHTVFTHFSAPIIKLFLELRASITAPDVIIDFADLHIQLPIIKLTSAEFTFQSPVISAARLSKNSAHLQYTPNGAALAYEPVYRCGSVEKMATAFLRYYVPA